MFSFDLPDIVYPKVSMCGAPSVDGVDLSVTSNGAWYYDAKLTSYIREFDITSDCVYTEYLKRYSSSSLFLSHTDIRFSTVSPSAWELLEAYPDMINPRDLPVDRIIAYEDLNKPLIKKGIQLPKEEMVDKQGEDNNISNNALKDLQMCLSRIDISVEDNRKEVDRVFNIINDLSHKVTKLEEDNLNLKKQISDLVDGQIPKDFSSNILENMFEENT